MSEAVDRPLRFDLHLPAHAISVAAARAVVRVLQRWIDEEPLRRLELVVSELVTNAVRHGTPSTDGEVHLELAVHDVAVHGCVRDSGPAFRLPTERPRDGQGGGFGLLIVGNLAESLIVDRWSDGNVVSFVVPTPQRLEGWPADKGQRGG